MSKKSVLTPRLLTQAVVLAVLAFIGCTQEAGNASESGIKIVNKEGTNPNVVAKYNGKEISAQELEQSSPEIYDAKLGVYDAQKNAVEEYVRQQVLDNLAKKANVSMDQFMQQEIEKSKKDVSEKSVTAFLKAHGVAKPDEVPANLKDQVRGIIHMQELIAKATKGNDVEFYVKRPVAPVLNFTLKDEATWGKEDAPVTIVEFSDFQCPYCAQGKERVSELKKTYGNKIHIVYKNFPLPMHPDARPAAEAALCVKEQGNDKFWAYHDILFENQHKLSADDLKSYAKKVGADEKQFSDCFAAKKYSKQIDASMEEGRKFHVNSTPTFFVNSQPVHGAKPIAEFRDLIDEALKKN